MKTGYDIALVLIALGLKEARRRKGLSQRALGERVGLPQSHVSKIESGAVDLQLSSLVQLARVLDMDVRLVPRKALPAVDSVVRATTPDIGAAEQAQLHDGLRRVAAAARELTRRDLFPGAQRLEEAALLLRNIQIPSEDLTRVRKVLDQLKPLQNLPFNTEPHDAIAERVADPLLQNAMRRALNTLRTVHRTHAVGVNAIGVNAVRPAYALDEDEDDA